MKLGPNSVWYWQHFLSSSLSYAFVMPAIQRNDNTLSFVGKNKQIIHKTSEIIAKTNKKLIPHIFWHKAKTGGGGECAKGNQRLEPKTIPPFPPFKNCVFLMVWKTIRASLKGAPCHFMTLGGQASRPSHKAAFVSCSQGSNSNLPVCFPSLHPLPPKGRLDMDWLFLKS